MRPEHRNEFKEKHWAPVMSYTHVDDPETICIPVFDDLKTYKSFVRRNTPAGWMPGGVTLLEKEIDWCDQQGWKLVYFSYPNRIFGHPDYKIQVQILEYQEKPDVYYRSKDTH